MDEKEREQRMEYAEEAEMVDEDRRNEEGGEPRAERQADVQDFDEDGDRFEGDRREEVRRPPSPPLEKDLVPLLNADKAEEYRSRWMDIQTEFVDDPRNSVENADDLVARVINSITENFANERTALEDQWNRGKDASTEDLRLAMKRYRSFFNRLLALEASNQAE